MSSPFAASQRSLNFAPSASVADQTRALDPWGSWYGKNPNVNTQLMNPEDMKTTISPDLPKAYEGKSQLMADRVNILVATKDMWYLTTALPLTPTNEMRWQMNVITFDQKMATVVPHKATSRLLDSRREQKSGVLVRRGIAYQMESQYVNTEEGQRMYQWHLSQMANAIIFTACVDVVQALIDCNDYRRTYEELHGLHVASDIEAKAQQQIATWAITQKQKNGLEILDAMVTEAQIQWQGESNMWIVPPVLKTYLKLCRNEKTDFLLAGPLGAENLMDRTDTPWSIKGVPAYISRMYDMDDQLNTGQGVTRNLLSRIKQIGSYYTMVDTQKNASEQYYLTDYQSNHRAIRVYNEVTDDWKVLTLSDAMEASAHLFANDGSLALPPNNHVFVQNEGDKDTDFLSHRNSGGGGGNNNDDERVPHRIFGHFDPGHLSPETVVNTCRTFVKHFTRGGATTAMDLQKAIGDGEALFERISEARFSPAWFWNVFFEHVKREGGNFNGNVDNKGEYDIFVKNITKVSKRDTTGLRVLVGKGTNGAALTLPQFDYSNFLKVRNRSIDQHFTASAGKVGGSSPGSLVGYGSWQGFLALQQEFMEGGSAGAGQTKNGYSKSDCATADAFVKAVKLIANEMSFLVDNPIYFDPLRSSANVEQPSVESTICEWIFGFTGVPLWLDVSKITNLRETTSPRSSTAANIMDYYTNFVLSEDASNREILSKLGKWLDQPSVATAYSGVDDLKNKLGQLFALKPIALAANAGALIVLLTTNKKVLEASEETFVKLLPFRNLTPAQNPLTNVLRSIFLDFIRVFVMTPQMSDAERAKRLSYVLNNVVSKLKLENVLFREEQKQSLVDLAIDANTGFFVSSGDGSESAAWVTWANDSRGSISLIDPTEFVKVLIAVGKTITKTSSSSRSSSDALSLFAKEATQKIDAAYQENQTMENIVRTKAVSKVVLMMGFSEKTTATNLADVNYFETSGEEKPAAGAGGSFRVQGGLFGDTEDDLERGALAGEDDNTRFYRTDLVFSAKQILQLWNFIKKSDRDDADIMRLRVSDPTNLARHLNVNELKVLVNRIKEINDNASRSFARGNDGATAAMRRWDLAYQPASLFFINNKKRRDIALAQQRRPLSSTTEGGKKRKRTTTGRPSSTTMSKRRFNEQGVLISTPSGMSSDEESDDNSGSAMQPQSLRREYGLSNQDDGDLINENALRAMTLVGDRTNSLLLKALSKLFLTSYVTRQTLENFVRFDILFPWGYVVFQPHKTYMMLMAIKMKGGLDTGATFYGHSDFMLQNEAHTKTHYGHFNVYLQAAVYNEKNVYHAWDIFSQGVVGNGGGFAPIHPQYYDAQNGNTGGGAVIFAPVPYEEQEFNWMMDVTGRFGVTDDKERLANYMDSIRLKSQHYSSCWRINQTFRVRRVDEIGALDLHHDTAPRAGFPFTNTVCIQGQQYNYDTASRSHTNKITNKGHWGDYEYPGIRKGRNGDLIQWQTGTPVTVV